MSTALRARALAVALLVVATEGQAQLVQEHQPDIPRGGRIVSVDIRPGSSDRQVIAASESGGLFMTLDGAATWAHLDGLLPSRLHDVRYAPANPDVIITTAAADVRNLRIAGRTVSGGGIWRSDDGGRTWVKPDDAEPPAPCGGRTSAWGVAFEEGTTNVYVGTDCGLAVSNDLGESWDHLQVNGASREVYGVAAQNGIVDLCDEDGHHRLNTATDSWTASTLPTVCAEKATHGVAVVPGNPNMVYVVAKVSDPGCEKIQRKLWESSDGGASDWSLVFERCDRDNRTPFVDIGGSAPNYDVYLGDGIATWRQLGCSTARVGSTKCSAAASSWERLVFEHPDQIDIAFSSVDGCAMYMANDGGIEKSTDCGLNWSYAGTSENGLHALQLYHVFSQVYPRHTDLYIGTQDNAIWSSADGGRTWPVAASVCCEGGLMSLSRSATAHSDELITGYAISSTRSTFQSGPHFEGREPWPNPEDAASGDAKLPFYIERDVYVQWRDLVEGQLYLTEDAGERWDLVTDLSPRPGDVLIHVAGSPADPALYVAVIRPSTRGLVRITNVRAGPGRGVVEDVDAGLDLGVHGRQFFWNTVVGVNPSDPSHLIVPDVGDDVMKVSTDSGRTWTPQPALTNLITAGGDFLFDANERGTSLVSEVTFDPVTPERIFIGTVYNGIFVSYDSGRSWAKIPGTEAMGDVSGFAFDEVRDEVFVSSWGRGLWKLDLPRALTPDAYEDNESPIAPTPPKRARFVHRHLRPRDAVENRRFLGTAREEWVWTFAANLHDPDDRDFFRLTLPDPEADQPGHRGFPECDILPRETVIPGIRANLVTTGSLIVEASGPDTGDRVRVYEYDPGARNAGSELASTIACPRSRYGLSDLLVSYGERAGDDFRGRFAAYNLTVRYRIDIQTAFELPEWLIAIMEGEEAEAGVAAGILPLSCEFGTFPFCPLEEALTVPVPELIHPKCWADGPGCPMYYPFHWIDVEEPLLFKITSDHGTSFELVDGRQKTIAEAEPFAEDNLRVRQRLAVPALKPGLYALVVSGPAQRFLLEFKSLEAPADLNKNGVADQLERQLMRSEGGN